MTTERGYQWQPNAKQAQVLDLIRSAPEGSITIIGYGGAGGGGKTNLQANLAVELALDCPGSRILVGRQDYTDLHTTTLAEFDRCTSGLPESLLKRRQSPPVFRAVRASKEDEWSYVYFRNLDDWQSLMSEEYGWILIDEASQVSVQAVTALLTRLRHRPERKWGMVVTFNPFPSWCTEWFYRDSLPSEMLSRAQERGLEIRSHFVRARVDDNPFVSESYRALLAANPDPVMRAVLYEGDPQVAAEQGLYFEKSAIDRVASLCSDPVEVRTTQAYPDGPATGSVLIWERPLLRERYYAGADTADGKGEAISFTSELGGPDRNACAIYRLRDNVQVAAIYGRQEEHHYARLLDEYGRWYNNALLAVERNRRAVLVNLRSLGYPALYFSPAGMRLPVSTSANQRQEWGWLTDSRTRPVMLAELREALTMGALRPRDRDLVKELEHFGYRFDKQTGLRDSRPEALDGSHDDRIFAHALAWQARKQALERRGGGLGPSYRYRPILI